MVLSKEQVVELTNLLVQFNNTSRLWCNRGWTPSELAEQTSKSGPISMSFGPGLMQAFADGTINQEELEAELRKKGMQCF